MRSFRSSAAHSRSTAGRMSASPIGIVQVRQLRMEEAVRGLGVAMTTVTEQPGHDGRHVEGGCQRLRGRLVTHDGIPDQRPHGAAIPAARNQEAVPESLGAEATDAAELLVASLEAFGLGHGYQPLQRRPQRLVEVRGREVVVVVRATGRLGDDAVDDLAGHQVGRRHLEGVGRLDLLGGVAPEDRRAALGRDDAVDGVLLHQHRVTDGNPERATAAALASHHDQDRDVQDRHLAQVHRDRLGDATLFGLHTGVGGRGVDQADHRPAELLGQSAWPAAPSGNPPDARSRNCG